MLALRPVLTCIWKTGALNCIEAISSDLILKLFLLYCMFTYVVI